jgi:hypothetical protein
MKKRILASLLLSAFCISSAYSKTFTNKTYLSSRSLLEDMAMEYSAFHKIIGKDKYTAAIQATPFFHKTNNKDGMGKYFGYYASNKGIVRNYISVYDGDEVAADADGILAHYLIHTPDTSEPNFGGKVKFEPTQQAYGIRLDYNQSIKNFFFKASTNIAQVKNKFTLTPLTTLVYSESSVQKDLVDYLKGNLEIDKNTRKQQPLTHAKMSNVSKSGVADIDLTVGYNFWNKKGNKIAFFINSTIPTGNEAKGEYLFEPIYGNGQHFALGAGLDSKFLLWKMENDSIELLCSLNYKYLFKATEKRTVGLKDNDGNIINFGHYYLGGKKDELAVFPLANVLTQDIDVRPGSRFEAIVAAAFNSGNFTLDLGYNLYIKEGENLSLKHAWAKDTYAIANKEYYIINELTTDENGPFCGPFDPTSAHHYDAETIPGPIAKENLDLDSIKSPTQVTHKAYGSFSYVFNSWKYPLLLGLGSSFEFVDGNSALEGYTIWGKVGVRF